MKRIQTVFKPKGNEGFTVIEALVSLLIVAVIVSMTSNVIINGLHGYKRSRARLQMSQELELQKNQLLSKNFNDIELSEGDYSKDAEHFTMKWKIIDLSPSLKKIYLFLLYNFENSKVAKRMEFFKSKYSALNAPPPLAVESRT
jgi:type II secretory pathway pseudopilin PulG